MNKYDKIAEQIDEFINENEDFTLWYLLYRYIRNNEYLKDGDIATKFYHSEKMRVLKAFEEELSNKIF